MMKTAAAISTIEEAFAMMKNFALTVLVLLAVSAPALACLEPPEAVQHA